MYYTQASIPINLLLKRVHQYMTSELFTSLPDELRMISFAVVKSDEHLAERYSDPLPSSTIASLATNVPLSVVDSLSTYCLIDPGSEQNFLLPVLQNYINTAISPPTTYNPTERASACEICERDWVPLTYHHLIPKQIHTKAIKRGWHEEWQLEAVAWLCRACHSFVHKIAGNEELAKDWWTVDRLMSREDVQGWAKWMARVRWKAR